MKRILVTGANKGIGFAIARAVLENDKDTFVLLGSRDEQRGRAAVSELTNADPHWAGRLQLLLIDVADDTSVRQAADFVLQQYGSHCLYGIVNNAGTGFTDSILFDTLQVNLFGIKRVCEAFVPLLPKRGGRVVNITSAAAPNFVNQCSPERQALLTNPNISWDEIDELVNECLRLERLGQFADSGLGSGSPYGVSKACANAYTIALANTHPQHIINACTPGYIETDMTRPVAQARGVTPEQAGMKPPSEGAKSAIFLLFGEPEGSGRYYGSDALRSPLDRYRAPGSPAFRG